MPSLLPPVLQWDHILQDLQALASPKDLTFWQKHGLEMSPITGLISKEGKPGIPRASAPLLISQYHGIGHRGWKATAEALAKTFYILHLHPLCKSFVPRCIECIPNNPNIPHRPQHDYLCYPTSPFSHLQIDFTHMPKLGQR